MASQLRRQLKGILFDFDDTLIDWSGVRLNWREIEAERLEAVLRFLQGRSLCQSLDLDCLIDDYTERTLAATIRSYTRSA